MSTTSSSPSSIFDLNKLDGYLNVNLSSLLAALQIRLPAFIENDDTSQVTRLNVKLFSTELATFHVPQFNLNKYFDANLFNYNYYTAFGTSFPITVESLLLTSLNITINNNLPFNNNPNFNKDQDSYGFRYITCLAFSLLFNIKLAECSCFPKNINEIKAVNAGLGLNCISLECKELLKLNPLLFDDLIHSDCSDLSLNAAFISLNLFAGKNINVSVDINQDQQQNTRNLALGRDIDMNLLNTFLDKFFTHDIIDMRFVQYTSHLLKKEHVQNNIMPGMIFPVDKFHYEYTKKFKQYSIYKNLMFIVKK